MPVNSQTPRCRFIPNSGAVVLVKDAVLPARLSRASVLSLGTSFTDAVVYSQGNSLPALSLSLFGSNASSFTLNEAMRGGSLESSLSKCLYANVDAQAWDVTSPTPASDNLCSSVLINEIVWTGDSLFIELLSIDDATLDLSRFSVAVFDARGRCVLSIPLQGNFTASDSFFVLGTADTPGVQVVIASPAILGNTESWAVVLYRRALSISVGTFFVPQGIEDALIISDRSNASLELSTLLRGVESDSIVVYTVRLICVSVSLSLWSFHVAHTNVRVFFLLTLPSLFISPFDLASAAIGAFVLLAVYDSVRRKQMA